MTSSLPRGPGRFAPILLVLAAVGMAGADPDEDPSPLVVHGHAEVTEARSLGEMDFRFALEIENRSDAAITIDAANLLLAHAGGWLAPLDPDPMDGSFLRRAWEVPASERESVGSYSYRTQTPATHLVLSTRANGRSGLTVTPIIRPELDQVRELRVSSPMGVGVIGPLHVLPYSDGRKSVMLVGQHQVLDGAAPTNVVTRVSTGSDAGAYEPIEWSGLEGREDRVALWPFVRRIDVDEGFDKGWLRIEVSAVIDESEVKATRAYDVKPVEIAVVASPVLGAWQLGNGPGQTDANAHTMRPDHRYAYDMVVVEDGRTHRGDPHENRSYFAWNRSIRAVADGVVVDVCDREPDNPGYRGSISDCFNNRVVIQHDDGLFTAYLHVRQRSTTVREGNRVKAGQVIAKVGNSGNSAEPHLHFQAFRMDDTGRHRPIPVTFTNAFHDVRGQKKVEGVPVGGRIYSFKR